MPDPRLAERMPVACASCYTQDDVAHVDFMAAYEGPVVDPENPRAGRIDWLIVCERCVRQAYACLPDDARAAQIKQLESRLEAEQERAEKAEDYASRLEDAFGHRPEREPSAPKPKPAARKQRYAPSA